MVAVARYTGGKLPAKSGEGADSDQQRKNTPLVAVDRTPVADEI
jgi:hypothetical protein